MLCEIQVSYLSAYLSLNLGVAYNTQRMLKSIQITPRNGRVSD